MSPFAIPSSAWAWLSQAEGGGLLQRGSHKGRALRGHKRCPKGLQVQAGRVWQSLCPALPSSWHASPSMHSGDKSVASPSVRAGAAGQVWGQENVALSQWVLPLPAFASVEIQKSFQNLSTHSTPGRGRYQAVPQRVPWNLLSSPRRSCRTCSRPVLAAPRLGKVGIERCALREHPLPA